MVSFVSHVTDVLRGAAMAVADSVPGVSGGTIAFLLGFYERFIWSVHALLLGSFAEKKAALPFLVKLGCGWVCCFLVCAVILSSLFDTYIYEICSVFLGLTIAAVPIVIAEEREALQGRYLNVVFAVIGVAIVPLLMSFAPSAGSTGVDLANGSFGLGLYLFVAAIVAVSAMVLPGISGSTLLLIMGLYVPLISAVSAVVHREFACVPMLFAFGLGMVAGFAVSAKVIRYCFARLGLLVGSLYAIVMGATTLSEPLPAMSWETFSVGFFVLGVVILAGLQLLKQRAELRDSSV